MWYVTGVHREEDINMIYEMKTTLNSKEKIKPVKRYKIIPQCKICQAHGYTPTFETNYNAL